MLLLLVSCCCLLLLLLLLLRLLLSDFAMRAVWMSEPVLVGEIQVPPGVGLDLPLRLGLAVAAAAAHWPKPNSAILLPITRH